MCSINDVNNFFRIYDLDFPHNKKGLRENSQSPYADRATDSANSFD